MLEMGIGRASRNNDRSLQQDNGNGSHSRTIAHKHYNSTTQKKVVVTTSITINQSVYYQPYIKYL
jgi:hypothetical protein